MSDGDMKNVYISEPLSKCINCGEEHGLAQENIETGEVLPFKFCAECLLDPEHLGNESKG